MDKNWQNPKKHKYLLPILVWANFLLPQFFYPLFLLFGLIQHTLLRSKAHFYRNDTF